MARRSRKTSKRKTGGWMGKVLAAVLLVGAVGIVGGYVALRSYLHGDGFRRFLSGKVSKAAGVNGEFEPFRWDGLAVDTAGFHATGTGRIVSLDLDGLHAEASLAGVRRGVWELRDSSVNRLSLVLEAAKLPEAPAAVPEAPEVKRAAKSRWLPDEVEIRGLEIRELELRAKTESGNFVIDGVTANLISGSAKGQFLGELEGGTIALPNPWFPPLALDRARLSFQNGELFLNEAGLRAWDIGRVSLTGEGNVKERRYIFEGNIEGVPCDRVLSESWARRMSGELSSSFVFETRGGSPSAKGSLKLERGVLTALPVLDSLAAYADTRRFRVLDLTEARTDWNWRKGELRLDRFVIASEGLIRVEGDLVVRDRELDGNFRLGLVPGTLAAIPGAETSVFQPGERGLLWTPLRITGSIDDPQEDLTRRLIAAAGLRMFEKLPETGELALKFSQSLLKEHSPEFLDKGIEKGLETIDQGMQLLDKNPAIAREVGNLIDGLLDLGGKKEKDKEQNKKAD